MFIEKNKTIFSFRFSCLKDNNKEKSRPVNIQSFNILIFSN